MKFLADFGNFWNSQNFLEIWFLPSKILAYCCQKNLIFILEIFWPWIMDERACWALSHTSVKWQEQRCSHKTENTKKIPKSAPNFIAWYTGVIFHLPRVNMHQKILTMWAITTSKDFRIASYLRKIGMPKLLTLGMNNPVCARRAPIFQAGVACFRLISHPYHFLRSNALWRPCR